MIGLDRFMNSLTNQRTPASWLIEYFGGGQSKSGVTVNYQTVLGLPAVWSAVQKISGHVAMLPLNAREQQEDGGKRVVRTNPGHKLLNVTPNEIMTAFTFRECMMMHCLLHGNGRAYIERNAVGSPIGLIPVLPGNCQTLLIGSEKWHLVTVGDGTSGQINAKIRDGQYFKVPDRDMLHILGLSHNGVWGLHPIEVLKDAFGLAIGGQDSTGNALSNNGRPGIIIKAPPGMFREAKEAEEFLDKFQRKHSGVSNSNKPGLLREGMDITTLPISAADAQLLEQRQFQRIDIASIFGLESVIGDQSGITYKSISERNAAYINGCLARWFAKWEQECESKLLPTSIHESEKISFDFDTTPLLKGDPASLADYTRKMREQRAITTNEIRDLHGFNPVEGGEDDWAGGLNESAESTDTTLPEVTSDETGE